MGGGRKGTSMQESEKENGEAGLQALCGKLDSLTEALGRLETRLDCLHEECQRTASAGQRMLMRQEGLAKSLARLEALLQGL